jgi:hypothetical protein
VMNYTPRQLAAFLFLAGKRRQRELRDELQLHRLAAHGDEKAIRATLREWQD